MFFKPKPKPEMKKAIELVGEAIEIAYKHLRDKKYQPTESDLKLFERLGEELWHKHCTAKYIARNMGQRFRGEPEGAKKFTDKEVFDWHYPP